jgi:hypothetical protein
MLDGINIEEFEWARTLAELHKEKCSTLPKHHRMYLVLRMTSDEPSFKTVSGTGLYQQKDPSYPMKTITSNWVDGASIIYIGKAGGESGIHGRVRLLVNFGFGKAVAHRGECALWHLEDSSILRLCWKACGNLQARAYETELIQRFRSYHGKRPFANMRD